MTRTGAIAALAALLCLLAAAPSQAASFPTKLFLSQDGVALSQFPNRSTLKKTVHIERTNGHGAANWTASSDQTWLSVTPSGTTGGDLTLKANTRQLATDQFYLANVTVSTADADFSDTEIMRVGLYVGATDPATITFNASATTIATNPVTPVAYVAGSGTSVDEYNVYTGALIGTFKKVAPTIGYMEMSSDGKTLFLTDTTSYKIVALDTASGEITGRYSVGYPNNFLFSMAYVRAYGQPALYLSGYDAVFPRKERDTGKPGPSFFYGHLMAVPSGEELADGVLMWGPVAATPDGRTAVSTVYGGETNDVAAYKLTLAKGKLSLKKMGEVSYEGDVCTDIAVSHDGRYVFPACGEPYRFDVFDSKTLTLLGALPANPYPNNIEIDSADHIVGGISGIFQADDVYVYDKKGRSVGMVATTDQSRVHGQQPAAMKISGDATRVVSVTYVNEGKPQTLMFRNMP